MTNVQKQVVCVPTNEPLQTTSGSGLELIREVDCAARG
jgi:hypothetical protein